MCDKMPDTGSRSMDVFIVIEMNFCLLEGSDESFSVSILPGIPATRYGNLNTMTRERRDIENL